MTLLALTESEHTELLTHADVADPPRRGRTIGAPDSVARVEAQIPLTYSRLTDGTAPALGWSVSATYERVDGEVDVEPVPVYRLLDVPGAALSVATAGLLLGAVGERGDRRFSLRMAFNRFSGVEA